MKLEYKLVSSHLVVEFIKKIMFQWLPNIQYVNISRFTESARNFIIIIIIEIGGSIRKNSKKMVSFETKKTAVFSFVALIYTMCKDFRNNWGSRRATDSVSLVQKGTELTIRIEIQSSRDMIMQANGK